MEFAINPLVPELWCSDFETSLDFYTRVIGCDVVQRRQRDRHAYLALHDAQIMIAHWQLDGTWAPWLPQQMTRPFGRGINLQFMVPDARRLYQSVVAQGGQPLVEIYEAEIWRTDVMDMRRQFLISDPDGYVLRFAQSLGTRPVAHTDHDRLDAQYGPPG